MISDDYFKLPRLYVEHDLSDKTLIELDAGQAHYLHNVLRRKNGEFIRLFNGRHGEWRGTLNDLGKKSGHVVLKDQLKAQPESTQRIHLIFTPIKKNRMDWLIEKAVELGVTDFHPVLTQNTEVRKVNAERIESQIFEAAEQCERFTIPALHKLKKLEVLWGEWDTKTPVLACLERFETQNLQDVERDTSADIAFLIGPEGGFTAEEKLRIAKHSIAVSLGDTILRCETAVVKALVLIQA